MGLSSFTPQAGKGLYRQYQGMLVALRPHWLHYNDRDSLTRRHRGFIYPIYGSVYLGAVTPP